MDEKDGRNTEFGVREQSAEENGEQENDPMTGTEQIARQSAALERLERETGQIRRGDRIASGVVGALVGILLTLLVLLPILMTGGFGGQKGGNQGNSGQQTAGGSIPASGLAGEFDSAKMTRIFQLLERGFLYRDDLDMDAIEDAMFHALMSSLGDDYACYYNEEEFQELLEDNEGSYYGIGVLVSQNLETNVITVSHVFRGSPAEEAGMKEGDVFHEVAGQNVQEMAVDDVVTLIRGEEGSTVTVTVYRESEDNYVTMEVERRQVEQDLVYWEMLDGQIGYIELVQFTGNASNQLAQALSELGEQGMKGVILDLRGNPGGLLSCVVDIGGQLLPEGNLLTIKSLNDETTYPLKDSGFDYPLVVLVNEYSASASEVLTGAIQDYGVGTIVGVTTFGKGIVQEIYPLGDQTTGIKFTTSDYYTPLGRNIHGKGIEPDVYVELDDSGEDNQLAKAIEVLKEKIDG